MPPKDRSDKDEADKEAAVNIIANGINENEDSKCGVCIKVVSSNEDGICCEICGLWFHCKCQGVPEQMYKAMNQFKEELHWFCKGCQAGAEKLLGIMSKMHSKIEGLDAELIRLRADWKTEIEKVTADFRDAMQQTADELKNSIEHINGRVHDIESDLYDSNTSASKVTNSWADMVAKDIDNKITVVAADVSTLQQQTNNIQRDIQEQDEINKKKNCVIIQGLKESVSITNDDWKNDDLNHTADLLHEIQSDDVSVTKCFRLGKLSEDPSVRPRPIKLVLASEAQKEKVLKRAKNLRGNSNGLDKVFIHQDLTPKQREARKQLVQELKSRRAQGEQDLMIVGDRIVKRRGAPDPNNH